MKIIMVQKYELLENNLHRENLLKIRFLEQFLLIDTQRGETKIL